MLSYTKLLFVLVTIGLLSTGCGQKVGFAQVPKDFSQDPSVITNPGDIADAVPQCEVDIPQLKLDGNVNTFEFAGSIGIVFGYNSNGSHSGVGVDANVQVSWAQLDLSMVGTDPLAATVLASTEVTSDQTKTNIGVGIDFNQFNIGPQFFFQTPLATVTANGLKSGIGGIKSQTDKMAWVGRVLKHIDDNTVLINAGDIAGVKVGDVLDLNNVTHFWSGAPCASTYYGSTHDTPTPDETIQISVVTPNQNVAIGQIIKHGAKHSRMGAEVLINQLGANADGSARYLKKKILLGKITANAISLPGGGTFDFQSVMNSQVVDVLNQTGAYIFTK